VDGQLTIRSAERADAPCIAELLRRTLTPCHPELVTFGCHGAADFIAREIGTPHVPARFFVAVAGGTLVGALELRVQLDGVFVNHIAVEERCRGRGVGTALLRTAFAAVDVSAGRQVLLDVAANNAAAARWYGRLGFTPRASVRWLELDSADGVAPFEIRGLTQGLTLLSLFGFGEIRVRTAHGDWAIGMLGSTWFRLTDPLAASEPGVWAALRRLDAQRRVFLVHMGAGPTIPTARELARFHRLQADLQLVINHVQQMEIRL
jgi:ribosomal protein S18 acetylase RimI-like enzyme